MYFADDDPMWTLENTWKHMFFIHENTKTQKTNNFDFCISVDWSYAPILHFSRNLKLKIDPSSSKLFFKNIVLKFPVVFSVRCRWKKKLLASPRRLSVTGQEDPLSHHEGGWLSLVPTRRSFLSRIHQVWRWPAVVFLHGLITFGADPPYFSYPP